MSPRGPESMGLTRPPGAPAAGSHRLLFGKSDPNVPASGVPSAFPLPVALSRVQTDRRHISCPEVCPLSSPRITHLAKTLTVQKEGGPLTPAGP